MERALNDLGEGIRSKQISLDTKNVTVDYDDSKITIQAIKDAIEEAGFDAEQVI